MLVRVGLSYQIATDTAPFTHAMYHGLRNHTRLESVSAIDRYNLSGLVWGDRPKDCPEQSSGGLFNFKQKCVNNVCGIRINLENAHTFTHYFLSLKNNAL